MIKKIKELGQIIYLARKKNIPMRKKLMLYLCTMVMAGLGIVCLLLVLTRNLFGTHKQIQDVLQMQLDSSTAQMQEDLEQYTGYGLSLSGQISQNIDNQLKNNAKKLTDYNDDQEALIELQRQIYPEMNTTIQICRPSGVYAVLDATVNTKISGSEKSRSGLYLRLKNVTNTGNLMAETIFFRGSPDIAREKELELHNRWNLEFNTDVMPGYHTLVDEKKRKGMSYFWSEKTSLTGTWEDVMFLCVPIIGNSGDIYGRCGVELNSMYFNQNYTAVDSKYGSMVTILAPVSDQILEVQKGMTGSTDGTWLQSVEDLKINHKKYYNEYISGQGEFIGLQKEIQIPGEKEDRWVVAVLLPKDKWQASVWRNRNYMMLAGIGFLVVMFFLANHLSQRFVKPILRGFSDIVGNKELLRNESGIEELEELLRFTGEQKKNEKIHTQSLPPNIEELFTRFALGVCTLTKTEYIIFHYYMEGYEIAQIPEIAFISMSTVKKHNRNIYEKLKVSSYNELMLYLDLFERCGRISELER